MRQIAIVAVSVALFTTGAQGQERLIFASPAPAPTPLHAAVLEGWVERVNEASEGTLQIELVTGGALAMHGQVLERVQSGVVQIGWDIQGYYTGMFPRTEVVAMPFGFETAEAATMVLNEMASDGPLAVEYQDVHLLNMFTFPNGYVLSRTEVHDLDSMRGLRTSSLNPTRQAIAAAIDGVPVSLSISDWYQGLSRGTIDAVIESYSAVAPFGLAEVTNHFIEIPLGGNAAFVFMNKDVYASLPEPARMAIDANTGPEFHRMLGAFWDGAADAGRDMIKAAGGTITVADEADREAWEAAVSPVVEAWVASTPDGQAVLDTFRAAVAELEGDG